MKSGFESGSLARRLTLVGGNSFPRIAPFAVYMMFIVVEDGFRFLTAKEILALPDHYSYFLYPLKVLVVALTLCLYKKRYSEINLEDLKRPSPTLLSIVTGLAVFAMWIRMDFSFATMGKPPGFNPFLFHDHATRILLITARLVGAVIVVPLMEEIFWRSFLLRYIIRQDFTSVRIGLFTWPSFIITSILFGLEHHFYIAGIIAGIAYNLILYRTRSLSCCILAHAVTNLALGVYVISSGKWYFW